MSDLIERDAAIKAIEDMLDGLADSETVPESLWKYVLLNEVPSAEVPEQKTGKWIEWQAPNGIDCGIECSECGYKPNAYLGYGPAYCPTCGARMEWE